MITISLCLHPNDPMKYDQTFKFSICLLFDAQIWTSRMWQFTMAISSKLKDTKKYRLIPIFTSKYPALDSQNYSISMQLIDSNYLPSIRWIWPGRWWSNWSIPFVARNPIWAHNIGLRKYGMDSRTMHESRIPGKWAWFSSKWPLEPIPIISQMVRSRWTIQVLYN